MVVSQAHRIHLLLHRGISFHVFSGPQVEAHVVPRANHHPISRFGIAAAEIFGADIFNLPLAQGAAHMRTSIVQCKELSSVPEHRNLLVLFLQLQKPGLALRKLCSSAHTDPPLLCPRWHFNFTFMLWLHVVLKLLWHQILVVGVVGVAQAHAISITVGQALPVPFPIGLCPSEASTLRPHDQGSTLALLNVHGSMSALAGVYHTSPPHMLVPVMVFAVVS
mmetsp:Transcript_79167/g.190010  ORF Transcript_79167/g.190010 Transcript_79167/m.190010 type:complete len:221 (-) Transcript_79167:760-1422(-)